MRVCLVRACLLLVLAGVSFGEAPEGALAAAIAADLEAVGGGVQLAEVVELFGGERAERYVFDNGLILVVLRDAAAPVFSIQTWVRVGSRHEELGHTGTAHLFEHLMFRATEKHADGEYDRLFEERGCQTNADTWLDRTRYYEDLPSQFLDFACEMEADRLVNLVLDEDTFSSELEVVKNERRQSVDNDPAGKLDEEWTASLFGREHPYGWPTLGWMKDLDAAALDYAKKFYKTYYAPNAITLIIVGDVARQDVLASVKRHYGSLAPSDLQPRADPPAPTKVATEQLELTLDFSTERLMMGWVGPPVTDPDHVAFELALQILFGSEGSRWQEAIVRNDPIATEVSAWALPFTAAGGAQLSADMLPGHTAEEAEAAALAIVQQVLSGTRPITAEELAGAQNRLELESLQPLQTAHGKAEFLGESAVVMGDLAAGKRRLDSIRRVSLADITRVIALCAATHTSVYARPENPEEAGDDDQQAEEAEAASTGVLTGPGGSRILVEEDNTLPLINIDIVLRDGSAADPVERPGLTSFACEALARGAGGRSRTELEEAWRLLGSSFDVAVGRDLVHFRGTVLARNLREWLDLAALALLKPEFPSAEIEKQRLEFLAALEALRENDSSHADVIFARALFGETGYGLPSGGTPQSLAALGAAELRAWHGSLHGGDFLFAASGAVSKTTFAAAVGEAFADLPPGPARQPGAPAEGAALAPGVNVVLVDKPGRTQARWVLGFRAPGWQAGAMEPFEVANTAFGGTFKARLNDELRVKNGWTYGAFSGLRRARTLGTFRIGSATETSVTVPAITRTLEMLQTLCDDGITQEELDKARSYLANSRPFEIDTAQERLAETELRLLEGLAADYHSQLLARVAAVEVSAANASVQAIIQRTTERLLVVLGDAKALEQGLRALPGVSRFVVIPAEHLGPISW